MTIFIMTPSVKLAFIWHLQNYTYIIQVHNSSEMQMYTLTLKTQYCHTERT